MAPKQVFIGIIGMCYDLGFFSRLTYYRPGRCWKMFFVSIRAAFHATFRNSVYEAVLSFGVSKQEDSIQH